MRICLFSGVFFPRIGGVQIVVDGLARQLEARGHEVVVLTPLTHRGPVDRSFPLIQYQRPLGHRRWPRTHIRSILKAYRQFKFEILLAVPALPMMSAAIAARRFADFIVVGWCHGGEMNPGAMEQLDPRSKRMAIDAFRRVDHIVTVSDWLRRHIRRVLGETCPDIDVIPELYDADTLDRDTAELGAESPPVCREHPWLQSRRFVLTLSRLARPKNLTMAIAAVDRLRDVFLQGGQHFVICGDGDCRRELEQQVAECNLQDIVRFVGIRGGVDKAWLLANARMLVSTSKNDAFPLTVLEAAHFGCPVLLSDGPFVGHREFLGDRGCGRLFPVDDLESLVRELQFMLETDLTEMSVRAEGVTKEFTPEAIAGQYECSLNAILKVRRMPGVVR